MIEFILSALASLAATGVGKLIGVFWNKNPEEEEVKIDFSESDIENYPKLFQTFHIKSGFKDILEFVEDPVVYAIVEDKPTTAYHLVTLVVESKVTGEWYVSSKSEMAFEGSGGGKRVSEMVATLCAEHNVKLTAWVLEKKLSDLLSSGRLHWNETKNQLLPLLTYAQNEYFIKHILQRYREVTA
ncbi:hypothetical protein P7M26_24980 [Vibrio parahaemolyticus]|uniref:hypothetical protein n=1 Tax=Vibrio parahaemolyticus TaxID=670 RepID=UPI0032978E04|nr:hypothetical protein [Vibrio parahaemolyticus]